jgi:hypothetical protein
MMRRQCGCFSRLSAVSIQMFSRDWQADVWACSARELDA